MYRPDHPPPHFHATYSNLLGKPLRNPSYFRRVRVDAEAGTAVWPNGLDPDPLILHGDYPPPDMAARLAGSAERRSC
jgi:hypothetical protein